MVDEVLGGKNHGLGVRGARRWVRMGVVGVILLVVVWVAVACVRVIGEERAAGTHEVPGGSIVWQTDYEKGLEEVKRTGKMGMIDFNAVWCEPCEAMKKSVWPDEEVAKAVNEKYVAIYLDVDLGKNAEVAQRYGIGLLPTEVVVDGEGKVLWAGQVIDKGDVMAFLKRPAIGR